MIASVRGTVVRVGLEWAVIEVGGVGMAVRTTPSVLSRLVPGEQTRLLTTLVVREDSLTLFGFDSAAAQELFETVQTVSGVGPRIALAMLAVLEPEELRTALSTGDTATLTRVPGIGRKSAERLVLELGDKVTLPSASAAAGAVGATHSPIGVQLTDALAGLGFTTRQASDAVARVTADAQDAAVAAGDVGVLLRRALALLGPVR